MMAIDEKFLTVAEVADKLAVSPRTVSRWLSEGRIKGIKLGGKKTGWRIRPSELEKFIADRERAAS
jgi:excisionase family DNA binding protein